MASNPDRFPATGRRLYCQQSVTLAAAARGKLSPPIRLFNQRARILNGVVTAGTITDAEIVLEQEGVRLTPEDGIPLESITDTTIPELALNRVGLDLIPQIDFEPTIVNNGGGTTTYTIVWIVERVET